MNTKTEGFMGDFTEIIKYDLISIIDTSKDFSRFATALKTFLTLHFQTPYRLSPNNIWRVTKQKQ